ncbi:MAG: rfbC [Chitinophagaceae bacterium]|jgi:dTDP-4-dehydrorhamnose 3,5-epimerase|nr:rfbC [Chitinophagaceae bacterium]
MQVETTSLQDCLLIKDRIFKDDRGYFFESFNQKTFKELTGVDINFVQDNQSRSQYGVLRGLHFQTGSHAQAKLVRVLEGKVLDVAVDIRKESPTYGKSFSVELSDTSGTQLFIPRGFAHGFVVLSETATFFYKCDNYYNKASESGIAYNDPKLEIDWSVDAADIILSEKDQNNPTLQQLENSL